LRRGESKSRPPQAVGVSRRVDMEAISSKNDILSNRDIMDEVESHINLSHSLEERVEEDTGDERDATITCECYYQLQPTGQRVLVLPTR